MSTKPIGYVVAHTHWDREWRYPLWQTRMLLVDFMDKLLDILEKDKNFAGFITDGQSVLIEDYLKIRPEKKELISKHIKNGGLEVGPWYTLPDLFPIDGECLVRNLLKGHRWCKSLGGKLNVGYTTFGWGQTAQFPQIFSGFGIDVIITGKNISAERAPDCEFWWQAPDGTRVLTSRLGKLKRMNFYVNVYIPATQGKTFSDDFKLEWDEEGLVFHSADEENYYKDYFRYENAASLYRKNLEENIEKAWNDVENTLVKDHRVLMCGADYAPAQDVLPKVVETANELLKDKTLKMATLTEYVGVLKDNLDYDRLNVIEGELRDGGPSSVSGNALMTRSYIKRLNKKAQVELFRQAEPLSVMCAMIGGEYKRAFLDEALQYMLLSHPHDSINGVTQDKTADDTFNRLKQALEISTVTADDCCKELIRRIDTSDFEKEDIALLIVNPAPRNRSEIIKVCIDTPRYYDIWDFDVLDTDGKKLEVQKISIQEGLSPVHDVKLRSYSFPHDRHFVYIETGQIPAGGYKMLRLKPSERFRRYIQRWPRERRSRGDEIASDNRTLENQNLIVTVMENGTVQVYHKSSGRTVKNCCYIEDTGDVGDYWVHYPAYQNKTFTSEGLNSRIWLEDNGPLSATIAAEVIMKIPAFGHRPDMGVRGKSSRSEEMTDVTVTTRYTLRKDAEYLQVKMIVDNNACDHRMRVMFDTGIRAKESYAAGHFNVDRRPVEPEKDDQGLYWPEMQTLPMQSFVDISDGTNGFAVISNSFSEYQALNNDKGTLAVTLFRSVRNILCSAPRVQAFLPHEKGGQSLGQQEYQFAVYPHTGDYKNSRLIALSEKFCTPVRPVQTAKRPGHLPKQMSFFKIEPDEIILSAFKQAQDRNTYILRFYNPTEAAKEVAVKLNAEPENAWLTNLNEKRLEQLRTNGNVLKVNTKPFKIMTLELDFEKDS